MSKRREKCTSLPALKDPDDQGQSSGEKFNCSNCCLSFQDKDKLNYHEKVHKFKGVGVMSKYCNGVFSTISGKKWHDNRYHRKKVSSLKENLQCTKCCAVIQKHHYSSHLKLHEGPKKDEIKCDLCGGKFYNKRGFELHLAFQHPDFKKEIKCRYCDFEHRRIERIRQHEATHPESDLPKERLNLSKLLNYKKMKPKPKRKIGADKIKAETFNCTKCCVVAKTEYVLKLHMHTHVDNEELGKKCEYCNGIFKPKNFNNHVKMNHTGTLRNCKFCDYETRNKHDFERHEKSHTGYEKGDHACKIPSCDAKFPRWAFLRNHMKIHHNKKPGFVCEICGSKRQNEADLNEHMKMHDKENSSDYEYTCRYCPFKFKNIFGRGSHETRVHGKTKNSFTCEIPNCGFKAPNFRKYEEHYKIHLNKTGKYRCEFCDTRFDTRSAKTTHIKFCHKSE